jgi:hypothetical protein
MNVTWNRRSLLLAAQLRWPGPGIFVWRRRRVCPMRRHELAPGILRRVNLPVGRHRRRNIVCAHMRYFAIAGEATTAATWGSPSDSVSSSNLMFLKRSLQVLSHIYESFQRATAIVLRGREAKLHLLQGARRRGGGPVRCSAPQFRRAATRDHSVRRGSVQCSSSARHAGLTEAGERFLRARSRPSRRSSP